MAKEKKYLWCSECKCYPDRIIEVYSEITIDRTWDKDCYAMDEMNLPQVPAVSLCGECETKLVER